MPTATRIPNGIGAKDAWTRVGGTTKYGVVTDDSDATQIETTNTTDEQEFTLTAAPDQDGNSTNVAVVARAAETILTSGSLLNVSLYNGVTLIETVQLDYNGINDPTNKTANFANITEAQAETDLRIRVKMGAIGGAKQKRFKLYELDFTYDYTAPAAANVPAAMYQYRQRRAG